MAENSINPCTKRARLQRKINDGVLCLTCERKCIVNKYGFCKTRKNIDGVLHTLIYGEIAPDFYGIQANPIEKNLSSISGLVAGL
ncbi:MAG: hypothetical protein N3A65_01955 [candidate division WOR-3 bacterium]|nr:hypothetical protein [candidate division WOR-3 bacterium]